MKLTFESNLNYQQEAIKSITDLFEGQPLEDSILEFNLKEDGTLNLINGVSNNLILSEEQILANLQSIQANSEIKVSEHLDGMHFSVEMETGTGKTYVYLRSIYELNKLYGFKKFVIVVPSVAIREGVLKNLEITHEHFQTLYDNVPVNFQVYDSTKVSTLRGFATTNNIEVLVINIDSFAKDENIINKPNDFDIKGFFDNIDHGKLMLALKKHVSENWCLFYIKRWLNAPVEKESGELVQKQRRGTPQGGVISPLLANLFLH
jgi:type III restriction enzyme